MVLSLVVIPQSIEENSFQCRNAKDKSMSKARERMQVVHHLKKKKKKILGTAKNPQSEKQIEHEAICLESHIVLHILTNTDVVLRLVVWIVFKLVNLVITSKKKNLNSSSSDITHRLVKLSIIYAILLTKMVRHMFGSMDIVMETLQIECGNF